MSGTNLPPFEKMTAAYFFAQYVDIPNWKNKKAGKSGRGKPLSFSGEEIKQIKAAWESYLSDLKEW